MYFPTILKSLRFRTVFLFFLTPLHFLFCRTFLFRLSFLFRLNFRGSWKISNRLKRVFHSRGEFFADRLKHEVLRGTRKGLLHPKPVFPCLRFRGRPDSRRSFCFRFCFPFLRDSLASPHCSAAFRPNFPQAAPGKRSRREPLPPVSSASASLQRRRCVFEPYFACVRAAIPHPAQPSSFSPENLPERSNLYPDPLPIRALPLKDSLEAGRSFAFVPAEVRKFVLK